MRPGFWQIVIVVGLLLLFFAHPLIRILHALKDSSRPTPRRGGGAGGAAPAPAARCYKCGASLPDGARFCPKCGRTQDVIDV